MTGALISRGLTLLATIIVVRILGKVGYGELGMIQSTVGMFGVFAGFGLGMTAVKHVAEYRKTNPEKAGRIIGVSGLFASITGSTMAVGLFALSPWMAENTMNAPHLSDVLRISSVMLFFNAINGAQTGALSGLEAFKTIAIVNTVVGLVSFPLMVGGAYFGGLTGAVYGLLGTLCCSWIVNHLALRKELKRHGIPLAIRNCGSELPILVSFSLPAAFSAMMLAPAHWVSRALLSRQDGGYSELGLLAAAIVFQTMILNICNILSAPLWSMISHAGPNISRRLSGVNILSTWVLGSIIVIPLLSFPEIGQVVFGSEFATRNFQLAFAFVVFSAAITMYKQGFSRILVSTSRLWVAFANNLLGALVLIGSSVIFLDMGSSGLALAILISSFITAASLSWVLCSEDAVIRGITVSLESLVIWGALTVLLATNIFDVSLALRAVAFVVSLTIVSISFLRIWNRVAPT